MQSPLPVAWHEAHAIALRREAMTDFWRGADAAWARVQHGAAARLARSAQRLQARLRHHHARRDGAAGRPV